MQKGKKARKEEEEEDDEEKKEEEEEEEDDDDEDLAPLEPKVFGRHNRGRMIQKMIATQPAADEFWDEKAQKFFAEEDDDNVFDIALDPDAKYVDKVDSDFDEDESSAESEEVEEEKAVKKKQLYQDPRNKKTQQPKKPAKSVSFGDSLAVPAEEEGAAAKAPKQKREYSKKQVAASDRVVRTSTKQQTEVTNISASIAKKTKRKNAKRVVKVYTQEELLREAEKTEKLNIAKLHKIKAWEEEEKAKRKPKGPVLTGPRVVYHSKGPTTTITFKDCDGLNVLPDFFSSLEGQTNQFPVARGSSEYRVAAGIQLPEFVSSSYPSDLGGAGRSPAPPPPPAFVQRPKTSKKQQLPKVSPKISPKVAVASASPSDVLAPPVVVQPPAVARPKASPVPKIPYTPKVINAAPTAPTVMMTPKMSEPKTKKAKIVKEKVVKKTPEAARPVVSGDTPTSRSGRVIKKSKLGDDFQVLD